MSHITEGDLHAYLDGALSLYPDEEARRIRGHLDECAECGRRLREEEDVREKSAKVLARTDPGPVDVPPFEEVRRMAKVDQRRSKTSRASALSTRLGWAASVVLALGTGWLLGRSPEVVLRPSVAVAPPSSDEEFLPGEDAISVSAAEPGRPQQDGGAPENPGVSEARARDDVEASVTADAERQDRLAIGRLSEPAVEAEELARERGREEDADDRVARASSPAAAPTPLDVPGGTVRVVGESLAAAMFEDAVARNFSESLPANMVVPGLPVLGIRWAELSPGVDGLVVRQRLVQDTTTLELRFVGLDGDLPDAEPPQLFGPVPEGMRQAVRPLAGGVGWVSLRGHLDQERLDRLLDLVR
jgi:hypothetical protein